MRPAACASLRRGAVPPARPQTRCRYPPAERRCGAHLRGLGYPVGRQPAGGGPSNWPAACCRASRAVGGHDARDVGALGVADRAHHARRHARHHHAGGHLLARPHHRPGRHQTAVSEHRAIQHRGADADQAAVAHDATVHAHLVPHHHVVADLQRFAAARVQHRLILNRAARAHPNRGHIAADAGERPHAGIGAQPHIAHHHRGRRHERLVHKAHAHRPARKVPLLSHVRHGEHPGNPVKPARRSRHPPGSHHNSASSRGSRSAR